MRNRIIACSAALALLIGISWYFLPDVRARRFSLPAPLGTVHQSFDVSPSDMVRSFGITLGSDNTTFDLGWGRQLHVNSHIIGDRMTPTTQWEVFELSVGYEYFE